VIRVVWIVLLICSASPCSSVEDNIWLKTYQNYKNYNQIIVNITKVESRLKSNKTNINLQDKLNKKLLLYKSKLSLYQSNNSFDNILSKYKYDIPEVTLRDYILNSSLNNIDRLLLKYQKSKNQFYLAKSTITNELNRLKKERPNDKKLISIKDDIEFFSEYSENIEKTHQNLLDAKSELNRRYIQYEDEVLANHILTLMIVIIMYMVYKIINYIVQRAVKDDEDNIKNYTNLITLFSYITILIFVLIRYIDDFLYLITFLSVIAAALTIALREIILNIAGALYIFVSRIIRVGDRVMVQFETKHTIGDIVDISLIKIRLNEVDDYSNIKEIKSVGRSIYIPNSYIFTKVFYNYSLKKNSTINELIEFEFDMDNDFEYIKDKVTTILNDMNIKHKLLFNLNSLKTGVTAILSYETSYKDSSIKRGEITIKIVQSLKSDTSIKLKSSKKSTKSNEDTNE
jgi:small-conductance mechanosensitive channel